VDWEVAVSSKISWIRAYFSAAHIRARNLLTASLGNQKGRKRDTNENTYPIADNGFGLLDAKDLVLKLLGIFMVIVAFLKLYALRKLSPKYTDIGTAQKNQCGQFFDEVCGHWKRKTLVLKLTGFL
jgi:hypothetical protein